MKSFCETSLAGLATHAEVLTSTLRLAGRTDGFQTSDLP
jgi:hypothetical protein